MEKKATYLGQMDELIDILSPTETTDPTGGKSTTWATSQTNLWAKVENNIRSDEALQADQPVAYNIKTFTIHYNPTITEKMRLQWRTKQADIITIDTLGRNQYTRIEAEFRDNQT